MNYTNNKEYSTPRSIFSSMLNECTAAYTKIDGNRLIVKNRDKNYEPEITVFHEIFDGTEILYYVDERARHAEGINEHGVGILYTTTSFKRDDADRKTANIQIIKSALTKKDPIEIMRILAHQDDSFNSRCDVSN